VPAASDILIADQAAVKKSSGKDSRLHRKNAHSTVTMKTEFKVLYPLGTIRISSADFFKFSNLLGTVYSQGNLLFSPDGSCLFSPVGNRVTIFDLVKWVLT
jgi:hypothetical protein